MIGRSYELPEVITILGGMVTWADEDSVWHTEIFEQCRDARDAFAAHTRDGDPAYMARLVPLTNQQALDFSVELDDVQPVQGLWPFDGGCYE